MRSNSLEKVRWFVLSSALLFIGYCWLDSGGGSLLAGSQVDNDEVFDEMSKFSSSQAHHGMGLMTEDKLL